MASQGDGEVDCMKLESTPPMIHCINFPPQFTSGSPCTPEHGFFDPFAPAVDDLMLASKYLQQPRTSAARSLNFGPCVKPISEENNLLEILYDDLMQVIQVASIQQHKLLEILDGFKTPQRLLSGVADNCCPPAPLKSGRKFVNIDRGGLCRKLEF